MKKLKVILFLGFLCLLKTYTQNPIIVLKQNGYYSSLNGPKIVLYDDSTVIFLREGKYYFTKLTSNDFKTLMNKIDLNHLLAFKQDSAYIYISDITTTTLWFSKDTISKSLIFTGKMSSLIEKKRKSPDNTMKEIISTLYSFNGVKANEWLPEYIEIQMWNNQYNGYDNLEYVDWPLQWPDTTNVMSRRLPNWKEPFFLIYLPKQFWKDYAKIWTQNKSKNKIRLFRMHGLSWQPDIRFPMPNEEKWGGGWYN